MNAEFVEIKTTFQNMKQARQMAEFLLDENLIACGQIFKIESHYNWKDKRFAEEEYMLVMKSRSSLIKKLEKTIKEKHPYEVPELVVTKIKTSEEYAKWVKKNTQGGKS